MAAVITRSTHPDALWPGVMEWFGLEYDEFPDIYPQLFDEVDGELATERLIEATGFGLARKKTESSPITYDSDGEGYATLATPSVIRSRGKSLKTTCIPRSPCLGPRAWPFRCIRPSN